MINIACPIHNEFMYIFLNQKFLPIFRKIKFQENVIEFQGHKIEFRGNEIEFQNNECTLL